MSGLRRKARCLRQINTPGNLRMADMRDLPDGESGIFFARRLLTLVRPGEEAAGGGCGDSGGPVFAYRGLHALVGIVVGGTSNATRAVAVAPYYMWIKDTIEKLSAP